MNMTNSIRFILIGAVLLVIGVAVPFLMILGLLDAGFLLLFASYAASVGGLLFGVVGAMLYVRERQG
ncbi:MAG: hypothetical protein NZ553_01205 [Caldilinea sp.]|nr:hypothetical protein [Caldilinea sp.]MDW8439066.1 hypothetical protein [Caldilineaceae bacterium]